MTPGDAIIAAWVVAILVIVLLVALDSRRRRAVPRLRHEQLVRSANHQAKIVALVDWLQDPKIVRTILEARVATAQGLQRTMEDIESLTEGEVDATVGLLLRERSVRRVVASYTEKVRGLPPAPVRKALREWAEPVKKELVS